MKRNPLRPVLALFLALTLLLTLAPTALAGSGTESDPYVYTGFNTGDFTPENGFDITDAAPEYAYGAFTRWVNKKLQETDDLYVRFEEDLWNTRQDVRIEQIIIGAGQNLHLELENGARVGNNYEANASNFSYFLVEPGGTLEITGSGMIGNNDRPNDEDSIQNHALILNYGTTTISGSIRLERAWNYTYGGQTLLRQHTVINYGNLTIEGSGESTEIPLLSTAAGMYSGLLCVGNTTVKNALIEMATVFAEDAAKNAVPTVSMDNVKIENAFGFVDPSNGMVNGGTPEKVGSIPYVYHQAGSTYSCYYHEAVDVKANVTLSNMSWQGEMNGSTDCYGILLLNSPSANVTLAGTQTNLKPVVVGNPSEASLANLQNQTLLSLTLTDVEKPVTISGVTVEMLDGKRAGYIKLNNSPNVTLENCIADAIILADGYLLAENSGDLAPSEHYNGQNEGKGVGLPPYTTPDSTNVTLVNCALNSVYLYNNVEQGAEGTIGMNIESGLYGFDEEMVKELFEAASPTQASVTTSKAQATITSTAPEGGEPKTVYAFAEDNEGLQQLIQQANTQSGDTVVIEDAEKGLELSGLAPGVTVKNETGKDITVNGTKLGAGESIVIPVPAVGGGGSNEPDYYPDYDEDVDYLPPVSEEEPEGKDLYMVTCRTLNVRTGDGTTFSKLGTLSRGTILTGSLENGWLKFNYNGKTAYCSADYLQKVEGDLDGLTVTCRTLNVRSGPSTNYDKIGTLSRGTAVDVLDVLDGWYKITFGDGEGYVSALYLA